MVAAVCIFIATATYTYAAKNNDHVASPNPLNVPLDNHKEFPFASGKLDDAKDTFYLWLGKQEGGVNNAVVWDRTVFYNLDGSGTLLIKYHILPPAVTVATSLPVAKAK